MCVCVRACIYIYISVCLSLRTKSDPRAELKIFVYLCVSRAELEMFVYPCVCLSGLNRTRAPSSR